MDETKRKYEFRPGGRAGFRNAAKADAQVIGETIDGLRAVHGPELATATVVEAARPEESTIHENLTWNDGEAGDHWRDQEARALVRSYAVVTISPAGKPEAIVANVSIRDEAGHRAYHDVAEIEASPVLQKSVLVEAIRDLQKWRRAWNGQIDEDILAKIDEVIEFAEQQLPVKEDA
jgi:hypothetical protein